MLPMALLFGSTASAADFTVASPGFYFTFNGGTAQDPVLTLVRGKTYTFAVNTSSIHPFEIAGTTTGVVNNNISSGTLTYNVPATAQNGTVNYKCSIHGFGNSISFVDPPPINIVSYSVGTNLVINSTGTTATNIFPEFNTDLTTTNWFALTVKSNVLIGTTNETFCGTPPGTNVFVRIRARR
jgi:hypothetical protein